MPNQPTQEQLQRHQEQLEAGLQRSLDLATAQVAAQNAQAVQNDSLPFFLTSAPYLQGRPQDAEPLTGEVRACARGEAVLTCVSGDGFVTKEIPVTVDYTVGQWLIKILLFGWAWY